MDKISIEGILTEDRQLLVQIPDTVPAGRVKITIDPIETPGVELSAPLTREEARRRLAAVGKLAKVEPILNPITDYDFTLLVLPPGSPGSEVLVDEDRGER